MINKDLIKQTTNQLKELIDRIEKIDISEIEIYNKISINFTEIDSKKSDEIRIELSAWEKQNIGSRYIYIIQATETTDVVLCRHQYENAKSTKEKARAYARLNDSKDSKVFYVGSSSSLGDRIKQHLGFGPKGTFALHVTHWSSDIPGGLTISIFRFPPNIDQNVIQAIEDGLWEKHRPIFGRRGVK